MAVAQASSPVDVPPPAFQLSTQCTRNSPPTASANGAAPYQPGVTPRETTPAVPSGLKARSIGSGDLQQGPSAAISATLCGPQPVRSNPTKSNQIRPLAGWCQRPHRQVPAASRRQLSLPLHLPGPRPVKANPTQSDQIRPFNQAQGLSPPTRNWKPSRTIPLGPSQSLKPSLHPIVPISPFALGFHFSL